MPYYDNATMLAHQYDHVRTLPKDVRDMLHVVVVDDASPNCPAVVSDLEGVPLQLYRIREDVRWNQDAARNIGVSHAESSWVLMTDIDHLVPETTWRALMSRTWDKDTAYKFNRVTGPEMAPYKPHPNTWFMTKGLFERAGGYDERFAGYYGTDGDFRDRLQKVAAGVVQLKEHVIRVPRTWISDASTTSYLRKQPEDGKNIAAIKTARAHEKNWQPLRGRFAYDRIHP